ncbi:beta-1,3-galactosyltransferase 4 [Paramormyrops kingsleyae]
MVRRGPWGCRGPLWKRRGSMVVCLMALLCSLSILFLDTIESWSVALGRNKAAVGPWVGHPYGTVKSPPDDYLLMPSPLVCQRAKPFLITMVISAPHHQQARQAIRDSWGGETLVRGLRVMTFFMVGQTNDPVLSQRLEEEAQDHRDIIQGLFLDTYSNLTLKTLSMLSWVQRFCEQAPYVAKVDDDVLFNPGTLLRYLNKSHSAESELYLGRVHMRVAPKRNPTSRHYLPAAAYTPEVFPDYCSGTAYVLSRSAARKISQASAASPIPLPLPPEDVFMGLSAMKAGIVPSHCPLFSGGPGVPYSRCCYQAMISVHHTSPREMVALWTEVQSPPPCSWLSLKASLGICKIRALLNDLMGEGEE